MNKKRFCIFIFLFCLWVIFSGIFQAKFLALGAASAAIISIITTPLLFTERKGKRYFVLEINYLQFLKYFCWLLVEIVKSTFEVCRAIIFPKKYARQQIIKFYCPFENPMAIVLLTNSIILTPGTVTVDVTDDDYFVVHALTEVSAQGIFDGEMMRRIGFLYGEKCCLDCEDTSDCITCNETENPEVDDPKTENPETDNPKAEVPSDLERKVKQ